jgi:hypothetical protein
MYYVPPTYGTVCSKWGKGKLLSELEKYLLMKEKLTVEASI